MAYQYPTYQQALPDTTLYERLQGSYTPIQGRLNPYANFEQGMLSQDALDYQADPFGYVKKKFGSLDEVLKKDTPDVGLGGLFGSRPSTGGDSGGDTGGRNYWADREAELSKTMSPEAVRAQILQEQVQAREKIPAQLLELLMPGMTVIKGIQSLFNPTPTNYATPWAQMTPAEKMYATNNQAPVSDSMMADAMRNDAIKNAVKAQELQQQGISLTDFGGPGDSGGGDSWSGSSNNDTFDSGGAGTGFGNVSGSDYGSYW